MYDVPFNLLNIFTDGAHRSKTELMLGPGSGINFDSDTDLPQQRLSQPYFTVRKMIGKDLRKLEDSNQYIRMTDCPMSIL